MKRNGWTPCTSSRLHSVIYHRRSCPAYVVDGLFENLLADVFTGNTSRRGLKRRYGFGTTRRRTRTSTGLARTARLRNAPQCTGWDFCRCCLFSTLVCMFWKAPFQETSFPRERRFRPLHAAPHFVRQDFQRSARSIAEAPVEFEAEWFASHFEFRASPDRFNLCRRSGTRSPPGARTMERAGGRDCAFRTYVQCRLVVERVQK